MAYTALWRFNKIPTTHSHSTWLYSTWVTWFQISFDIYLNWTTFTALPTKNLLITFSMNYGLISINSWDAVSPLQSFFNKIKSNCLSKLLLWISHLYIIYTYPPWNIHINTWKVGIFQNLRWFSFQNGIFSGVMLVSWSLTHLKWEANRIQVTGPLHRLPPCRSLSTTREELGFAEEEPGRGWKNTKRTVVE